MILVFRVVEKNMIGPIERDTTTGKIEAGLSGREICPLPRAVAI
jgi:hypothetical protein